MSVVAPIYRLRGLTARLPVGRDAVIAAAIAALTFVLLLPTLDPAYPSVRRSVAHMPDEGTILSNADRIARGHALYREVFDFKGPVGYVPFVIAFKIGPVTARAGRLTMFVVVALWAAVTYGAAKLITGRRVLAAVVAMLVPLQVWPAWTYAYQDFTAQLCLTVALLLALMATLEDGRPGWLVLSGAMASLALWTSLAQGLSGMVGLWGAAVLSVAVPDGLRAGGRTLARFGAGVLLGSAMVLGWLVSMGALAAHVDAMWLFPFRHYMSSANIAAYAYDESVYPDRWVGDPWWVYWAVKTMMRATRLAPSLALAMAVPIGAAMVILFIRLVGRPMPRGLPARTLARLALPAALAAPAVPVVLEKTRTDICHLGFIEGGCLLALLAPFALSTRLRALRVAAASLKATIAAALVALLVVAVGFQGHAIRITPPGKRDLDKLGRDDSGAELIALRVRPHERLFVTPYGGWSYLYSRRDNATSFAFLIDDPYSAAHWPIAARQIVERQPILLSVSDRDLEILSGHEPRIKSLYFGYSGNYMLDIRGDGPPFSGGVRWSIQTFDDQGAPRSPMEIEILDDGGSARFKAVVLPARSAVLRAALHDDRFSMFHDSASYVGQLAADGQRIEGKVFGLSPMALRFTAVRLANP